MTTSTSRLSFADCYDLFDRALDGGLRVSFDKIGAARHYRIRLHTARTLDRRAAKDLYPTDHPMFGLSIYDRLVVKIRDTAEGVWLYIEPIQGPQRVESLEMDVDGGKPA